MLIRRILQYVRCHHSALFYGFGIAHAMKQDQLDSQTLQVTIKCLCVMGSLKEFICFCLYSLQSGSFHRVSYKMKWKKRWSNDSIQCCLLAILKRTTTTFEFEFYHRDRQPSEVLREMETRETQKKSETKVIIMIISYLSWWTECSGGITTPTTHTVYNTPSGCSTPHGALGTLLHAQSARHARVNAIIVTRALALSRVQAQHLGLG